MHNIYLALFEYCYTAYICPRGIHLHISSRAITRLAQSKLYRSLYVECMCSLVLLVSFPSNCKTFPTCHRNTFWLPLSLCLSLHLFYTSAFISVYLSICVYLPICLACLHICLWIFVLSSYLFFCLLYMYLHQYFTLSLVCVFICLIIYHFVSLSLHLSFSPVSLFSLTSVSVFNSQSAYIVYWSMFCYIWFGQPDSQTVCLPVAQPYFLSSVSLWICLTSLCLYCTLSLILSPSFHICSSVLPCNPIELRQPSPLWCRLVNSLKELSNTELSGD